MGGSSRAETDPAFASDWIYETVDELPRGQGRLTLRARMRALELIEARLPRAGTEPLSFPLRLEIFDGFEGDEAAAATAARSSTAALLLLGSLDIGRARSGNRHLPRELARDAGHGYVFAAAQLALPGPLRSPSQKAHAPDLSGISGPTLLCRAPATALAALPLGPTRSMRREGGRELLRPIALFARFELRSGACACVLARIPSPLAAEAAALARLFEAACGYAGGDPLLVAISAARLEREPMAAAHRFDLQIPASAAGGERMLRTVFVRDARATVNGAGGAVSRPRSLLSDRCALVVELEPD